MHWIEIGIYGYITAIVQFISDTLSGGEGMGSTMPYMELLLVYSSGSWYMWNTLGFVYYICMK